MSNLHSSDYFAIIPEFVLYADVSPNAVRLYAILNRFANGAGRAWPSRTTLAELMRVSKATVDRAKDELVGIGALTVEHRTNPAGDPSSNLYTLFIRPFTPSSPMQKGSPTREGRGSPTGDALNRASMNQRHLANSAPRTKCSSCRGKNRDIDTHLGLSSIYDEQSRTYIVCPGCDGEGWLP